MGDYTDRYLNRAESAKVAEGYRNYRDLGPTRSLEKLHRLYRERAASAETDRTATKASPKNRPPTTRMATLRDWSSAFSWAARAAAWDAEVDRARREELKRQAEREAREDYHLWHQLGAALLAVAGAQLGRYVDATTGRVLEEIPARDLATFIRVGVEIEALTHEQPGAPAAAGDADEIERVLQQADEETRATLTRGLRAAWAWIERQNGG